MLFFPSRADRCRRKCLRRPCFLFRQETGKRTGQRGFPLCDSPTPVGNSTKLSARLATCLRTARYRLARRRYRPVCRFAPTLGGADEGATVGGSCRSRPKRGGCCPIAAHEVKRRPQTFCRALDGVKSHVTRTGFLRAEPLGVSFVQPFLHEQKRAGRRRQNLTPRQTPLCIVQLL